MNDDMSRQEAIDTLLDLLNELRRADKEKNEDRGVALMMGITALCCISTERLYEAAADCWVVPDTEVTS